MKRGGPLPEGFTYVPEFLSAAEERELVTHIQALEFGRVVMHGVEARRRVTHFGYGYAYETRAVQPGPAIPEWMVFARDRLGGRFGVEPASLLEALVTEYPPGAGIGWHRDAPAFGIVLAVSLAGACRMRFQRGAGEERVTAQCELAPRSAYALTGPARTQWQHSIPAARELRYSIPFRTLRRPPPL